MNSFRLALLTTATSAALLIGAVPLAQATPGGPVEPSEPGRDPGAQQNNPNSLDLPPAAQRLQHSATTRRTTQGPGRVRDGALRLDMPRTFPGEVLRGGIVRIRTQPIEYAGEIIARDQSGRIVGRATPNNGTARLRVDIKDVGTHPLRIKARKDGRHASVSREARIIVRAPSIQRGQRHPVVKRLLRTLRQQNFHTPTLTDRYTEPVRDVVLAFQKVHGLQRTGDLNPTTWKTVTTATPVRPRNRGSGTHLEVDKTRQIMMLVTDGKVRGTLHVSTGKTGNTPEGWYRIYAKGIGSLPNFMPFLRGFGFHGYPSVPAYPASHGCVRQPMWADQWTYARTDVGTRVFVYR